MAKARRYGVGIERVYNCFDAWVATETTLYVDAGEVWEAVESWEYDAVLMPRAISTARAERKARSLMRTYGAVMI